MIFKYRVKHNGITYEAGENVPIGEEPVKEEVKEVADAAKDIDIPSKAEIMRMPKAKLIDMALANGVADASEMTGAQLKAKLIEVFKL